MFKIRYDYTAEQRHSGEAYQGIPCNALADALEAALGRLSRYRGDRTGLPESMSIYSNRQAKWVDMIERDLEPKGTPGRYAPDWVEISVATQLGREVLLRHAPGGYTIVQDDDSEPDELWQNHVGSVQRLREWVGDKTMIHCGSGGTYQRTTFRDGEEENENLDLPSVPDLLDNWSFRPGVEND